MKTFLTIFLAVWLAVFTASVSAYVAVQTMDVPVDAGGVWLPDVTPSPWVES